NAARKALESAAAKGSAPAQYALGAAAEAAGDFEVAAKWFRQSADSGYAGAQFKLAQLLEKGQGVERDVDAAVDLYRKAAAQGVAAAISRLHEVAPDSVSDSAPTVPALATQSTDTLTDRRQPQNGGGTLGPAPATAVPTRNEVVQTQTAPTTSSAHDGRRAPTNAHLAAAAALWAV